ncbi:hypothetical protein [Levilactobacillus humaensis]|uniref:hypothetical protein n=1 Tax=Levilactobacillus humaensis TaxID=2950375 RepID=UPI0021C3FF23|nr:hypothetical protein [Levilactobacillus humaensis]
MQSRLTKSLFLGLAVLSLGAVSATTAQAASKTKVTSTSNLSYSGSKRNVQANGKNALYTKPGVVKGAKKVLSKTSMKKFGTSKKSKQYFRAYKMAKTNKGTYYYKVVSMDGKYRGYVYGGKKKGTFAGGIKKSYTTKTADMPSTTTMYFAKPGTKNVTWSAPRYTQYGASAKVSDTTPYATDELTVTKAVKKSREGTLYYYVKDAKNPSVDGYIYYKALTATKPSTVFNDKTDVKVNFKTIDGTDVKSTTLTGLKDAKGVVSTATGTDVSTDAKSKITPDLAKATLAGTGYTYTATDTMNANALAGSIKTGDTVTLYVVKNQNADTKINFYAYNGQVDGSKKLTAFADGDTATAMTVVFPALANHFTGTADTAFTASDVEAYLTTNNLKTLYTPSYTVNNKQTYTRYDLYNSADGFYSTTDNAKAFYKATTVTGEKSPADKADTTTTTATTTTPVKDTSYVG